MLSSKVNNIWLYSSYVFLECCSSDPAIKQFIIHLDETKKLGKKFIIHDLDEVHLFVEESIVVELQKQVDYLMEENSYSEFAQESKLRS